MAGIKVIVSLDIDNQENIMRIQQNAELEAAVFRRLLKHLDENKQVQNIELMQLAGFCRNCLSKWYVEAAHERGEQIEYEQAREMVYGMPYQDWKAKYQTEATPEQLKAFEAKQNKESS